ncbi:MAG: hypothetical protein QXT81_02905 [Candidatus Bathyarchaeia archaeon]
MSGVRVDRSGLCSIRESPPHRDILSASALTSPPDGGSFSLRNIPTILTWSPPNPSMEEDY